MGYEIGYGSKPITFNGSGTDNDNVIVASGTKGVLDAVLIQGTSDAEDVDITIESGAGVAIHVWGNVDTTAAAAIRDGLSCGPYGIEFGSGLRVDVTDNGTGSETDLTFLVRTGFA